MFVEEFKKSGGIWIMKPIGSAQGKGIFLFTRLSEISEWRPDLVQRGGGGGGGKGGRGGPEGAEERDVEAYVVQRYIQYPFLIGAYYFGWTVWVSFL
jgi:tubulin polyglutamylase TTLL9